MKNFTFCLLLLLISPIFLQATNYSKLMPYLNLAEDGSSKWLSFKKDANICTEDLLTDKYLLGLSKVEELKVKREKQDQLGFKHFHCQQFYKTIPIEGAEWIIHEKDGAVQKANGHLVYGLNMDTKAQISVTAAIEKAKNYIKAEKYAWEVDTYEKMLQQTTENEAATFYPEPSLVIVPSNLIQASNPENYQLAYKVDIFAVSPLQRAYIYVNAYNGDIIKTVNRLCHTDDIACTAHAAYTNKPSVDIIANIIDDTYRLRENREGVDIITYDCEGTWNYSTSDIWSADKHFDEDSIALAVHWGSEQVVDYLANKYNRNSYDDLGGTMQSFVHFGEANNNASWNGNWTSYGDGDQSKRTALTSLDIVGHEWTHALIQYSSNLVYWGESGALNESFCDILGKSLEFHVAETVLNKASFADWYIGGKVTPNHSHGIRNMARPNSTLALNQQPDTYLGDYWEHGNSDYGGVHTNSGVQNYWFYLLVEGGVGTNDNGQTYTIDAIGWDAAEAIVYRSLTTYLTSTAQYADARIGAIQAAIDLYGENSNEVNQVLAAWCAVGVGPSDCSINSNEIELISPNGGETFYQGDTVNITWANTGDIEEVQLAYSIDNGVNWIPIINQTNNSNNYDWVLPNISTNLGLVRVGDAGNNYIKDESDANFSIIGCHLIASFMAVEDTICEGATINFTNDSSEEATHFEWYIDGELQVNTKDFTYTFIEEGIYTITLEVGNGENCKASYSKTIVVNTFPDTKFSYINNNLEVELCADVLITSSYSWDFGDGQIGTGDHLIHTYAEEGTYNVCLTITDVCGSASYCTDIRVYDFVCGWTPSVEWEINLGGSNKDFAYSIELTEDEAYILCGETDSNDGDVSSNLGGRDVWIAKVSHLGELIWERSLGGSGNDYGKVIKATPDGGYILCLYTESSDGDVSHNNGNRDIWIVKLDAFGEILWERSLGGSKNDIGNAIQVTSDGGYIVCGYTGSSNGDVSVNYGGRDIWVVKLDSLGEILWERSLGGSEADTGTSIQLTSDGGYIVCGYTFSNDGDVSMNFGTEDIWLVKLDSSGEILWDRNLGGTRRDKARAIQVTADGGYIVCGQTGSNDGHVSDGSYGDWNIWVVRLNSLGEIVWEKSIGRSSIDVGLDIQATTDGNYIVCGYSESGDLSDFDAWIIKMDDSQGEILWERSLGGTEEDYAHAIQVTENGAYVICGYSYAYYGYDENGHNSKADIWLAKLHAEDTITTTADFSLPNDNVFCTSNLLSFTNTSTNTDDNTIYEWQIDGLTVSDLTNLEYVFSKAGNYILTLLANDNGCVTSHQENIVIYANAHDLNLDSTLQGCEGTTVLDAGLNDMQTYEWFFQGMLIANTPSVTINETGEYWLRLVDQCGNTETDSIDVFVDDDCVWPGDFNQDRIVNQYDLLPFALAFGQTGPARFDASFNWEGQACLDWEGETTPNLKHIDGSGNGIIDLNDPRAIWLNYGKMNEASSIINTTNSPFVMETQFRDVEYVEEHKMRLIVDVYIENPNTTNLSAYGLAFEINFSITNPEQRIHSLHTDFSDIWLGTKDEDLYTFDYTIDSTNNSFDIAVALSRIDHQNQNGSGKLARLIAEIDVLPTLDSLVNLSVSLSNIQLSLVNNGINEVGEARILGNYLGIADRIDKFKVITNSICKYGEEGIWYQDLDGDGLGNPDYGLIACKTPNGFVPNDLDDNDNAASITHVFSTSFTDEIRIFPIPLTQNQLHISLESPKIQDIQIQLLDINGQTIIETKHTINSGEHNLSLDLPNITPGMYFLQVNIDGVAYWYKVVK